MAKFNTIKVLAAGGVNLFALNAKDEKLLVVNKTTRSYVIPVIKNVAYIEDDDVETYVFLQNIIDAVNSNKVWRELFKLTPINKKAPEHSIEVVDFISAPGVNIAKNYLTVLKDNGYTMLEKVLSTSFAKRDYSALLKDPEIKKMFDEDAAELKKVGATFSGLDKETQIAYEAVENGSAGGIIFEGPTGTGKSFNARILANHAGAPLLNIQITYGTTIEDLVGQFIPNDEATEDGGSKWKFVMGPLLKAFVFGYQIVVEEVNYGQAGVIAKLNEFTDGTPRVTINGITYHKHRNFVCYMTMNPGYEGTDPLNVALKNRFAKVDVPALTKSEFIKRAVNYSRSLGHELSNDFFGKLFDFANFIEKEGCSSKWHENVKFSIRNAQRLCDCILSAKRNFTDFQAAMADQYLNDLSTDNDNSEKLQAFKKDKDIVAQMQQIYECYGFAEAKTVEVDLGDADFFLEEESAETTAAKDDMVEDLLGRFRYSTGESR